MRNAAGGQFGRHSYIIPEHNGGTLRGTNDEPEFLLAVSPDGRIKTLRYSTHGMGSKLTGKPIVINKRTVGVAHVGLTQEARDAGWRLLDDLYEAEGRMDDCEAVYVWYRAAAYRKSGKIEPLDKAYLPDALVELQRNANRPLRVELPPPQRSKKTKAKAKGPEPKPEKPEPKPEPKA